MLGIRPGRDVGEALAFLLEIRLDEGMIGEEAMLRLASGGRSAGANEVATRVCVTNVAFDGAVRDATEQGRPGRAGRERGDPVRDDVTDGLSIRRRVAMWRWLLAVGVAAGLLVTLVVVLLRLDADRSSRSLALAVVTTLLAGAAVVVTWLDRGASPAT